MSKTLVKLTHFSRAIVGRADEAEIMEHDEWVCFVIRNCGNCKTDAEEF